MEAPSKNELRRKERESVRGESRSELLALLRSKPEMTADIFLMILDKGFATMRETSRSKILKDPFFTELMKALTNDFRNPAPRTQFRHWLQEKLHEVTAVEGRGWPRSTLPAIRRAMEVV